MTRNEIASMIDHTCLSACAGEKDIEKLCAEAKKYGFASVCVNPYYVPLASELLNGSGVRVCTVIGFPLGAVSIDDKAGQASIAVDEGADEIDMVINLGLVKDGDFDEVEDEIETVVCASKEFEGSSRTVTVKVILETCYLTDDEIAEVCRRAKSAGADFVKTSTGFGPGGATVHAVELMRKTVGPDMGVKASGGIRTAEDAAAMIKAGASRLGCSAGVEIVEGWKD